MSLSLCLAFHLTKYDGPCDRILCATEEGKDSGLGGTRCQKWSSLFHSVAEGPLCPCQVSVGLSGLTPDNLSGTSAQI